jgi:UDP-N-acetylmuramoyl-tripeptide--D-alanyl-D-alanine ligase
LSYIAESCGGRCPENVRAVEVTRVCTDSRQVQGGDLFVALAGERFDGHDFLHEAVQRGATAMMVEESKALAPTQTGDCAVIRVAHPRRALGQLAARYRQDFAVPILAVGGSNGKTTTKELVAAVLGQKLPTLRSQASFNNDVGVPTTLLNLDRSHRTAVLEVGTNHPGELAPLVRMIQPQIGVITSIGREHLEFFGGLEGVVAEEGWLAELLPDDGVLFINGDIRALSQIIARTRASVVTVGLATANDWRVGNVTVAPAGTSFKVVAPNAAWSGTYRLNLLGRHQVGNALLSIAIGAHFNMSRERIQQGLEGCPTP